MKIAFRLDASDIIGMGHAIRSSALAKEFQRRGHSCCFFSHSFDSLIHYYDSNNLEMTTVHVMDTNDEISWLGDAMSNFDILILDTYNITDDYIKKINDAVHTLCCMDDNSDHIYDCDLVVNQNLFAKELSFHSGDHKPQWLLGGKYCLLRNEFRETPPIAVQREAKRVFVCFGGSDVNDYTPRAVRALLEISGIEMNVVLGPATRDVNLSFSENISDCVHIEHDPKSISKLMSECDIAVIASGSMVYEVAATGIPMIAIAQAENQKRLVAYLKRNSLGIGFQDDFPADTILADTVSGLLHDYDRRLAMHGALINQVDRYGVCNTADMILEVAGDNSSNKR